MNARRSIRGRWCSMAILIAFVAALFICGTASAADIYVGLDGDYATIQAAVTAATAGDTIIVRDGIYSENVNVGKELTIRSENGSANCSVSAESTGDHVFEVTADWVNITGFNVTGATGSVRAGIYLSGRQHCNISDNNASGNSYGIYLTSSSNYNTLTNNTASTAST